MTGGQIPRRERAATSSICLGAKLETCNTMEVNMTVFVRELKKL